MTVGPNDLEVRMLATVRVQEKGQVTIPSEIRKKLKLRKGDLVTFVMQENGVVIKSVESAAQDLLRSLENDLGQRGVSLETLISASQRIGGEAAAEWLRSCPLSVDALTLKAEILYRTR